VALAVRSWDWLNVKCVYDFFVFQDSPWKGLKMEASHQISIIFMLIIVVAPSESGLSPGITDIAVDHPKTAAEESESLSEGKNFREKGYLL
jgi:hypothetical protein